MAYTIVSDTSANLPEEIIEKNNITMVTLSYFVNGIEHKCYEKDKKTDLKDFYEKMRAKEDIRTSLASPEAFSNVFEDILKKGEDILCITISSSLSGTHQSARIASEEMKEKYPDRKILILDSYGASLGMGLLVMLAVQQKNEGKDLQENFDYLEKNKLKIAHWFTVDDLFFLKRGGRINASTAIVGSVLGIKPLMHMDIDGKLTPIGKVRGRKKAIEFLIEKYKQDTCKNKSKIVTISHGDCLEDAEYVASEIEKIAKPDEIVINFIDPGIGTHSGPGTLALFYIADER